MSEAALSTETAMAESVLEVQGRPHEARAFDAAASRLRRMYNEDWWNADLGRFATAVLPDGTLEEQVYRAGFDDQIPPGLYAKELSQVIEHLEAAIPFATPKMARALAALVHLYRTGEPIDIPASKVPGFKAGKALKDAVN